MRMEGSAASGESPRRRVTIGGGDYEHGQEKGEGKGVWLGFIGGRLWRRRKGSRGMGRFRSPAL